MDICIYVYMYELCTNSINIVEGHLNMFFPNDLVLFFSSSFIYLMLRLAIDIVYQKQLRQ